MKTKYISKLKLKVFGDSHSPYMKLVVYNLPKNKYVDFNLITNALNRRRPSKEFETPRVENDNFEIKGLKNGKTSKKITIKVYNNNIKSENYLEFNKLHRPGHIDYVSKMKFGKIYSGSGIFSARMTVLFVVLGNVISQIFNLEYDTKIIKIGKEKNEKNFIDYILDISKKNDSVGGYIKTIVRNVPSFIGSPIFNKINANISYFLNLIPGIKSIFIGNDFNDLELLGSQYNDRFIGVSKMSSNNQSGINGGITNGQKIALICGFRPPASISKPQETFNFETKEMDILKISGRHDSTFLYRAMVVVESYISIAIMDTYLSDREN